MKENIPPPILIYSAKMGIFGGIISWQNWYWFINAVLLLRSLNGVIYVSWRNFQRKFPPLCFWCFEQIRWKLLILLGGF
jgi:hypothetical protein